MTPRFKPGDRVKSEYMSWKQGVITQDKRGKYWRTGNSGPSTLVLMDDDPLRQVWWAELDLLRDERQSDVPE